MLANRGLKLPTNFDVTQLMFKGKEAKTSHNNEAKTSNIKGIGPPKSKEPKISQNTSNNVPSNYHVDVLTQ